MTNFQSLANKYGTPLYVYDFDYIQKQYNLLKEAFRARKSLIAYAIKANSNLSVIQHLGRLGAGADCVSIGEVHRALKAGIESYKIIFSGVGKRDDEIEEALRLDILFINIESEAELQRVSKISSRLGKKARISIRVNPNIDPQTHPYISTGLHENKFGVELELAKRMYIMTKTMESIEPVGIHFHIGSQLTQIEPIREAAIIVADMLRTLKAIDINLKFFDAGGGLGVVYDGENTIEPHDYAQTILDALNGLDVTVISEPGRFLSANSGYFLTKVLYEKVNGDRRFVVVDGAMNDLLRPSLYNSFHSIDVPKKVDSKVSKADIVGPVCESGDFLVKEVSLPAMEHNDLLIIKSAGAYGFVMSSNYNTRSRSAEVALQNGEDRLIRRRETFEDVVALEIDLMGKE